MRNAFWILVFLTGAIIGFGCTDRKVREQLNEAERLIMTSPDSALHIIEAINMDGLRESKDKALYGLLYTMALDKNHMPLTNDSIISFSVDYYKRKDDKLHLAMSLYYCGRVLQQTGHISSALVSYLQAIDVAEEIGNKFYAGMACRGMSDIYSDSFNAGDELAYAKREYENIKEAGIQPYINYAMYDLAKAYHNNEQYEEVYTMVAQIKDSALAANDLYLYETAKRLLATSYIGDRRPQDAINIYMKFISDGNACAEDSSFLCTAYALNGNLKNASELLYQTKFIDDIRKESAYGEVMNLEGRYKEALYHFIKLDSLSNEILYKQMINNYSTSITDNYKLRIDQDRTELRESRLISISILLSAILIMNLFKLIYIR